MESAYSEEAALGQGAGIAAAVSRSLNQLADRVVYFQYKDFIFVTYGLFGGLGTFVALWWMGNVLLQQGFSQAHLVLFALSASLGILLFSRLAALVLDYRLLLRRPRNTLRSVAFASWGGILAIPFLMSMIGLAADFRLLLLMDACARGGPLGHAIGRLGCLSYGCCFGRPSRSALAITYTDPQAKAVRVAGLQGVPLHPAPLYEVGLNLAIFALVNAVAFLGAPQGVPTALYMLTYGAGRFVIEFSRDNKGRLLAGRLAVNHALALTLLFFGAIAMLVVLLLPAGAPDVSLLAGVRESAPLLPVLALGGLLVALGFSIHRGRVGEW